MNAGDQVVAQFAGVGISLVLVLAAVVSGRRRAHPAAPR